MDEEMKCTTNVPLQAVMDMYNDSIWKALQTKIDPRGFLEWVAGNYAEAGEPVPDWIMAGINCMSERDVLPVCTQVYLADWMPKMGGAS